MTQFEDEVKALGLRMTARYLGRKGWKAEKNVLFDNWRCDFLNPQNGAKMSTLFHMGIGHNKKRPDMVDVLSCVIYDADVGGRTLQDILSESWYDDDKEAREVWRGCVSLRKRLIALVGEKEFEKLVSLNDYRLR